MAGVLLRLADDPVPLFFLLQRLRVMLLLLHMISPTAGLSMVRPGCTKEWCGDIQIPYPYGMGPECYKNVNFSVICEDRSTNKAPTTSSSRSTLKPYFLLNNGSTKEIVSISLIEGQIRTRSFIDRVCYNGSKRINKPGNFELGGTIYRFSHTRNMLTAIGFNTLAFLWSWNGDDDGPYGNGCIMRQPTKDDETMAGRCSGVGCCEASIPSGLNYYRVRFLDLSNNKSRRVANARPCSYGFLVENSTYAFHKSDLEEPHFDEKKEDVISLVLDWTVGPDKCENINRSSPSYACVSASSECRDSESGHGYFCTCAAGYEGNPYLPDGCQDIDECTRKPGICPNDARCENTVGNYTCRCSKGWKFDMASKTCRKNRSRNIELALGLSISLAFVAILSFFIYWELQRRKYISSRRKFFEQNGGILLKQQMKQGGMFKVYKQAEIEKATNKFDKEMLIGKGGQGVVYKGNLDNRIVAIKRSRTIDESQRDEYGQEMLILSQINHKHVVKLLGCCLEVEIPMLIYEFISKGTLFSYLHKEERKVPIPFIERLRIASQAAQALNYLHNDASPPIIHGDVKTDNILLDDKLGVKVSDFGASRMTPLDKEQFATLVQGTYGYLDPESIQTHQLTTKSDVYSFGVVLAELLTRKTALYHDGSGEQRSLALDFVSSFRGNQLVQILDVQIVDERNDKYMKCIDEVAKLTCHCLSMRGEERPTMGEVAMELEGIRKFILQVCQPMVGMTSDLDPLLEEEGGYASSGHSSTSNTSNYFTSTKNVSRR